MSSNTSRDTRSQLIDAAETVVSRDGPRSLTLDAVAAQAGISKGGLLHHFRSSGELAAAMIERSITWFDDALIDAGAEDPDARGRFTRAYIKTSLGMTPLTGASFDNLCSAITVVLLSYPERLGTVQEQGQRTQKNIEEDGLDPVLATIIRLAIDGLWLSENLNMMRFDKDMKAKVAARLLQWAADSAEKAQTPGF